jgi:uncharacterized membrane protein YedE/YeeE
MTITEFTPLASTIGGALIGVSAVMLMLFNGRIAGISGILGRFFRLMTAPTPAGLQPLSSAFSPHPWSMQRRRVHPLRRPFPAMWAS